MTSSQLIIGLKSYRQIIRLARENHFKKIAICCLDDPLHKMSKDITYLFKKLHSKVCNVVLITLHIDNVNNQLDNDADLIISYGTRICHDIVKSLINRNIALYCIETDSLHMSSYGTGIFWDKDHINWKKMIPHLIFNNCDPDHNWNIHDLIYFLHDVPLALDACLLDESGNEFIQDCAFQGILYFLKSYQKLKNTKNKHSLKQIYIDLAYADILMKNAYNNAKFSDETKRIASSVKHYRQFEVSTCFETLDILHNHLNARRVELIKILKEYNVTIKQFQKDIEDIYFDFINHPQRQEAIYEIIGHNLQKVLALNQKTRRIL